MSPEHEMFRLFARELRDAVWSIQENRTGAEDPKEILELYLAMLDHIIDHASEQRRAIRHSRGEAVEPKVHYATAVVAGVGSV